MRKGFLFATKGRDSTEDLFATLIRTLPYKKIASGGEHMVYNVLCGGWVVGIGSKTPI